MLAQLHKFYEALVADYMILSVVQYLELDSYFTIELSQTKLQCYVNSGIAF